MIFNRVKFCCCGGIVNKNKGFTLIELMVTIAVLGIIAAMAVPSFQSVIQKNELKKGTEYVLFILNDAKNNARLTRQISVLKLGSPFSVPSTAKEFDVGADIGKNVALISDDKAVSFLANGLIETTAKNYPICISIKHSKSLNSEYISITQLGFITHSQTSCDTK